MIKFNNIYLSYNRQEVIQDLSFEVKMGEKAVISGKSGSGKSSLFALILGFVKPVKGEIIFEGVSVDEKSAWDVRKKVAYIDQGVSIGEGKALDLPEFALGLKANASLNIAQEKIDDLLTYFELGPDVINKNIGELSGGERQRLAIIISVLLKRKVFLLDEVTSALDKHLKKKVADYFMGKEDWTTLVISHDPVWIENPSVKAFDMETGKWKQ